VNPDTPIQYAPGVGPKRAELFNKLGVHNVEDLLNHFPRDWVLPTDITDIGQLELGKNIIVIGEITRVEYIGRGRIPRMKVIIDDGTGELQAIWFNGGWLRSQLKVGKMIMMTGKTEIRR
jgi:ATP-dependent DNA helicase RecG